MMVVRPIQEQDWCGLRQLAGKTGIGFTSLQDDDEQVRSRLDKALCAFDPRTPVEEASYLFVMEDCQRHRIAGICGIEAAVGLQDPWYNYRVGIQVNASRELKVYKQLTTLSLSNDHTGFTELCTLFLDPDYRHSRNGHLLSKSRFLFIAAHRQRFPHGLMAEMRGCSDEKGMSPFWEGLGRHFFAIDFSEADQRSAKDKVFIAELMPKHTLYVNLLSEPARAVIGLTHEATLPARKLLESEGLRYSGYVDIFDGGPLLEARVDDVRAIRDSREVAAVIGQPAEAGLPHLISTTGFRAFRCVAATIDAQEEDRVTLTREVAAALGVEEGETLRIVPLFPPGRY